ncbi:L-2-hydroxyglutarate oxidase [Microbacterium sp. ZKA21]|uniref:L-2-hydroxyglutarate oxidase n=1 Tax=Microbacterium sp. ZKA21 TaxID=3381694 RepID=UPI003D252D44
MLPNVVLGGGIVGLATARAMLRREPDRPLVILEKEQRVAVHQTGRNSGVIHSGLYYAPGSLKADFAIRGGRMMREFCDESGIAYDVPGKLVVATREQELPRLEALRTRGLANGVPVRDPEPGELAEREPHLRVLKALVVDSTGRVDYGDVSRALQAGIEDAGGEMRFGVAVEAVREGPRGQLRVDAGDGSVAAHRVAVCAGLHADRVARRSGLDVDVRIVPFRGEYSELRADRAHLVKGLVYPVPDPDLPFLGVHLTRGIDGSVHVGPNAVPALAREGYSWSAISLRDTADSLAFSGTWRLGAGYALVGLKEIVRSLSGRALLRAAQTMVPDLRPGDLRRSGSGVRAQAVGRDGRMLDDFFFLRSGRTLHVLNAPSPAATASLLIGEHIADQLLAD